MYRFLFSLVGAHVPQFDVGCLRVITPMKNVAYVRSRMTLLANFKLTSIDVRGVFCSKKKNDIARSHRTERVAFTTLKLVYSQNDANFRSIVSRFPGIADEIANSKSARNLRLFDTRFQRTQRAHRQFPRRCRREILSQIDRASISHTVPPSQYAGDECPICSELLLNDQQELKTLSCCNKRFHLACIAEWAKKDTTCPRRHDHVGGLVTKKKTQETSQE